MCAFNRALPGPPEAVLSGARRAIQAGGGTLTGDSLRGAIHLPTPMGDVDGEYTVQGSTIAFRITRKPFLVPCAIIESRVDAFLSGSG